MFYSIVTLLQKIASSLAVPTALLLLEASGYLAASDTQPESAVRAIRILVGPIPAGLLIAAICFAIFYPLNREGHHKIVAELEARRAAEEQA